MRSAPIAIATLIAGLMLLTATVTAAVEEPPAVDRTLSPYFLIESGDPDIDRFPLKDTRVTVAVNGVIADVTVVQQYRNDGPRTLSARYIFPASTRAAVHGMKMQVGEQVVTARVAERGKARRTFDKARKKGRAASLLEQQRPNVFSMDVANIKPADTVTIELRYTELLVPEDGTYAFVYPTVVGPRYASQPEAAAEAVEAERWVQNPYLPPGRSDPTGFGIAVDLSAGMPLQQVECPSHAVDMTWDSPQNGRVLLAESERQGGNRDFVLNYRLADRQIQTGMLLFEGPEENFFLLMVQPPHQVSPADIPPREYIFVVDVSGSMNGFPLNTAKKLLADLLAGLRPVDSFNLVLFAGASRVMAPASLPVTPENLANAVRLMDRQRGGGGTELAAALKKALALPRGEAVARSVLLVTDGYISAEREAFELVAENLSGTSVFAFGIGSSVNRYLVEGVARVGMGEPFIVTEPDQAAATAARFREYVSAPVLTGVSVAFDGFQAYDVEPPVVPDLLAQRPLVVFGKWRGPAAGSIRIDGTSGPGPWQEAVDVAACRPDPANQALPYLWARHRLARLSDHRQGRADADGQAEITSLGLTYNLLTARTSFVAVHEAEPAAPPGNKSAPTVRQPLPLPAKVSHLAVGGVAPVPEPELGWLVVAVLLLAALDCMGRQRNRIRRGPARFGRRNSKSHKRGAQ